MRSKKAEARDRRGRHNEAATKKGYWDDVPHSVYDCILRNPQNKVKPSIMYLRLKVKKINNHVLSNMLLLVQRGLLVYYTDAACRAAPYFGRNIPISKASF